MSEVTVKNSAIPLAPGAILVLMLAPVMLLSGCYSTGGHVPDRVRFPERVPSGALDFDKEDKAGKSKEALPVARRLALSDAGASKLYSFKAMGQSLRVSLMQFAEANKLNVIFDQDVAGVVNVEFHDVTLEQALDSILNPIGLGWIQEDGMIRIVLQMTKTYQVDYLRAARTGNSSMTSSSSGSGSSGSNSISKTDAVNFWSELETELKSLLTKASAEGQQTQAQPVAGASSNAVPVAAIPIAQVEGRVTVNKLTGIVQVTTSPRRMKAVDAYMESLIKGINRQVYIEARIVDVALTDDTALGIDWTKMKFGRNQNLSVTTTGPGGTGGNIITAAVGGASVLPATVSATYNRTFSGLDVSAAIQALEQQGTVRVISQPKVRTLNNQAAVIKVGTDRTFYTLKTTVTNSTGGISTQTTEDSTLITEGVVLSVTPQISPDGMITLDVMPVINKIVGVDTSPSGNSNAARVETKQSSSLVRLKDGETAVIGGLIVEEDSETTRQLPGAGNIPFAGWLSKGKYSNKIRKELVIFITPHLIEN